MANQLALLIPSARNQQNVQADLSTSGLAERKHRDQKEQLVDWVIKMAALYNNGSNSKHLSFHVGRKVSLLMFERTELSGCST